MTTETILDQLRPQLCEALGIEPAECLPEKRLASDLGAESIDLVDLTFRIEKTFNLQIPEGELFEDTAARGHDLTLQQVAEYICCRLGSSS